MNKLTTVALMVGGSLLINPVFADEMDNNKQMQVKNLNDSQVAEHVNKALSDFSNLTIEVKNKVVYLSGELASDTDYEKAVTLAESIKGVHDVNVDELSVKDSDQPLTDAYITAKVKGALIKADSF